MSQVNSGREQLENMNKRRTRQAPGPRQPKREISDIPGPQLAPAPAPEPEAEAEAGLRLVEEPPPTQEPTPMPMKDMPVLHADTSTTVQVTSYITAEALAAVKKLRGPGTPGGYVALEAISAMQDRLALLISERQAGHVRAPVAGGLFPSRSGAAAGKGAARRMWLIRLTPAELEIVDSLAAEFGAASRSELISVAVEAYVNT